MTMRDKKNRPRAARSLTFTLALFLTVFSAMTLVAAQSSQAVMSQRTLNSAIANQQQLLAQQAGASVANSIQQKFSVMETAVGLGELITVDLQTREARLEGLLGLQPAFK